MDATEAQLWEQYRQDPSVAARNALAEFYLPFVRQLAVVSHARIADQAGLEVGDFVSWGVVGLLDAIRGFDVGRGLTFKTYSALRIRGAMLDGIRELDWVPRLDRSREAEARRNGETFNVLQMVPVDPRNPGRVDRESGSAVAMAAVVDSDDPKGDHAWRQICRSLNREERLIVMMRFRLDMNMKEIGANLGVSESRISQMLKGVLDRLAGAVDQDPPAYKVISHWHRLPRPVPEFSSDGPLVEFVPPDYSSLQLKRREEELFQMNIDQLDREILMTKRRLQHLELTRDVLAGKPVVVTLADIERKLIVSTLERLNGDRGAAAVSLGIAVRTLQDKLREYGYGPRAKFSRPNVEASADVAE